VQIYIILYVVRAHVLRTHTQLHYTNRPPSTLSNRHPNPLNYVGICLLYLNNVSNNELHIFQCD
jgi:hypothetical protein